MTVHKKNREAIYQSSNYVDFLLTILTFKKNESTFRIIRLAPYTIQEIISYSCDESSAPYILSEIIHLQQFSQSIHHCHPSLTPMKSAKNQQTNPPGLLLYFVD